MNTNNLMKLKIFKIMIKKTQNLDLKNLRSFLKSCKIKMVKCFQMKKVNGNNNKKSHYGTCFIKQ